MGIALALKSVDHGQAKTCLKDRRDGRSLCWGPQISLEGSDVSSEEQTEGNWGKCGMGDGTSLRGSLLSHFTARNWAQALNSLTHRGCCWPPNNPLPSDSSCPVHTSLSSLKHSTHPACDLLRVPVICSISSQPGVLGPSSRKHGIKTGYLALAFAALKLCNYCCGLIS